VTGVTFAYLSRPTEKRVTPRNPKWPHGPEVTARDKAIADSLDLAVLERIHAEAEEAAARIMANWEGKR
jgi:hypothetical protein